MKGLLLVLTVVAASVANADIVVTELTGTWTGDTVQYVVLYGGIAEIQLKYQLYPRERIFRAEYDELCRQLGVSCLVGQRLEWKVSRSHQFRDAVRISFDDPTYIRLAPD